MKKLALLVGVAAVLAFVPAQAASADLLDLGTGDLSAGVFPDDQLTALSSSGYPFTVGGGTTADAVQFAVSAHNGPKGPSGYAVVKHPVAGTAQGHVVCYLASFPFDGGRASFFSIVVEKGSGFLASSPFLLFRAFDSGQPGGAGDQLGIERAPVCAIGLGDFPPTLVTQGNIVIKN